MGLGVRSVAASGVVAYCVLEDGSLWSWGSSKRGALGQGVGVVQSPRPRRVAFVNENEREPAERERPVIISSVSAGWGHALALAEGGEVFAWGWPAHGRLGRPCHIRRGEGMQEEKEDESQGGDEESRGGGSNNEALKASPNTSPNASPNTSPNGFSSSPDPAFVESRLHALCAWSPRPVPGLHGADVVAVECGNDHSLALTRAGVVLSFGDPSLGALGRHVLAEDDRGTERREEARTHDETRSNPPAFPSASSSSSSSPRPSWMPWPVSDLPAPVVSIAAGLGHSLALDGAGRLWAWGWDPAGQLGRGEGAAEERSAASGAPTPCPVDAWGRLRRGGGRPEPRLAAGRAHSLAAGAEEEPNEEGEQDMGGEMQTESGVGEDTKDDAVFSPHTGTEELVCLAWGAADNGRLGTGETVDSPVPEPIPELDGKTIIALAAGWDHSLALVQE